MRWRTFILMTLCLAVAFNGAGAGVVYAYPATAAESIRTLPAMDQPMIDMDHEDCAGHDHSAMPDTAADHHESGKHSGDCCKSASCACGCETGGFSITSVGVHMTNTSTLGVIAFTNISGYTSPVLPYLIRPPIFKALSAP